MMRAAAVSLVLIVGAAVVLWFANMLNSWVLGGLMGGLAAILLSIPISLTLFSFLSRKNEERIRLVEQEERALLGLYGYTEVDEDQFEEASDEYPLLSEPQWLDDAHIRRVSEARRLPAPAYPRLPAGGQSQASAQINSTQQRPAIQRASRQLPKAVPGARAKNAPAQRLQADKRPYYPGFPGYRGNVPRSTYQSAALRIARQEAARQQRDEDDEEILPYNMKRLPSHTSEMRSSGLLSSQTPYQNRPRRTVDALPPQTGYFPVQRQISEPRTEHLSEDSYYPQTGPISQQSTGGTTGPVTRQIKLDRNALSSETSTGGLKNPLVRRAPYLYEDDPLRQELAQQLDPPTVRRSSRYEDEEAY